MKIDRNDGSSDRKLRRFLNRKPPTEKRRESFAREADGWVWRLLEHFMTGKIAIEEIEKNSREKLRSSLQSLAIVVDQKLVPRLEALVKAAKDMTRFQEVNALDRDAELPDDRTQAMGIVALVLVVEWIASSYFYSERVSNVFLGVGAAAFPALLTLGVGFFVATLARHTNYSDWKRRTRGLLVTGALCLTGVCGHFLAAHYRDRFPELPGVSFLGEVVADPLVLSSASVWMFLLGVLSFALISYKLYKADDPYPGYGNLARKLDNATEASRAELARIQNLIDHDVNAVVDEAEAMVHNGRSRAGLAVRLAEEGLRKLGIFDPASFNVEEEKSQAIVGLVKKWEEARLTRAKLFNLGDIRSELSTRPDQEPGSPPVEIENLAEAVTVTEAMGWLDRLLAEFGVEPPVDDDSDWEED